MNQPRQQPQKQAVQSAVKVRGVSVVYNNGHKAIDNVSFDLYRGTITALVGVNGSGKSSLFKAMMGFVPRVSGSVHIHQLTVKQALRQNMLAYVPQSEEIDWDFPVLVEDVVMMGRYGHMSFLRRPKDADHQAVNEALQRVDMQSFRHRQIGELSGGQRKRVFLARALAQKSRVILLDEPFTGVDVGTEDQIIALLKRLAEDGCVILVSTHNLGSVPQFCDRCVLLNRTVLAEGETEAVFNSENLQKAFGGVLRRFVLSADTLHTDADPRELTVLSDDESPLVLYGEKGSQLLASQQDNQR